MKHLVLLLLGWSVWSLNAAAADEPRSKAHEIGKDGLKIEGTVSAADPRVRFRLNQGGNFFEHHLHAKFYDVKLASGKQYTIRMEAVGPKSSLDSYLVLKDEDGNTLAFDDDGGGKLNARIDFDAPRKGTYRIYTAALGGTGRFVLKISATTPPKQVVNVVRQGFPAAQSDPADLTRSDTAWEIEWHITSPGNGHGKAASPSSVLAIRSAKFMFKNSAGKVRWFTVLKNLEVGEIMVPYDRFQPVFLDVSEHSFHIIPAKKEYLGPNCVLPGAILESSDPRMNNKVYKEVHDDGLRWLNQHGHARRGEKMLLWAVFHGGNYRYLIEYGFRDDGSIHCRLGATAHNYFNHQKDKRDVHLHVACWRWDPELSETGDRQAGGDSQRGSELVPAGWPAGIMRMFGIPTVVGGASANQVLLVRRLPRTPAPTGRFRVDVTPFNANEAGQASEGFADWMPEEFTILRVQSLVRKNSSKNPQFTAYDLIPVRLGTVRNYPWKYAFANHDFWVTHRDPRQKLFRDVPLHATYGRPLDKTPVTIWHNSASYHVPRGEDYGPDGQTSNSGSAITTWAECFLKPVNLFDGTPMYPAPAKKDAGKKDKKDSGKKK